MGTNADTFLRQCQALPDGFVALGESSKWRLGGVVYARAGARFAAIQKTQKPGYEFSDLWALPGGMVRDFSAPEAEVSIAESVARRAAAEAGFAPTPVDLVHGLGPVTTSYTVDNAQKWTLVVAFECKMRSASSLQPSDHSVQAARWTESNRALTDFAPANQVIIGHLLWPEYDDIQRRAARDILEPPYAKCVDWANQAGVVPPAAPWSSSMDLEAWSQGWPHAS